MGECTPSLYRVYDKWGPVLLGAICLTALYATVQYSFLLFHALAEAYSIIVALAVFVIFWNTRQLLQNGMYLVIGFGCLFAGLFDLIYIFAYPGMSMFPHADGNLALQAKTVAQWYVSLSCVGAFWYLHRMVNQRRALLLYGTIAALALAFLFYWRIFPDCFIEGVGVTAFERIGLVISCTAYLVALALLIRNRREFDNQVYGVLAATLVVFLLQDAVSALALRMDDLARIVAHLCQVVAIYFVYKAFVQVGLRRPYDLLFRSLQQSAEEIRRVNQTLQQRAEQLQALAAELTLTEQRERRHLAKVLHDHLQQILVAAKMKVKHVAPRISDRHAVEVLGQVDELLAQSIAESRSLTIELSPPVLFDRGLVGGLEWLARWFLEKHELRVFLDLDAEAEPADEATRVFLFQAARELLLNTVKHAQAQSAWVRLTQSGADHLRLVVSDDGQGFDPSKARQDHTSGGFGLFSIRERLMLLGGRLEVVSAPGRGTKTAIEVPGVRPPPAAEPLPSGGTTAEPATGTVAEPAREEGSSQRIRVLLADDHPLLRKGLGDVLQQQSQIEVVGEASDGQEAVELACQKRPDVVLMDVTMPRLTGIEATRHIRARLPTTRVIGLSMHHDEDMACAMREAGAVDYLSKTEPTEALIGSILTQSRTEG